MNNNNYYNILMNIIKYINYFKLNALPYVKIIRVYYYT